MIRTIPRQLQSSHLEMARLRLRYRFLANFPASNKTSTRSKKARQETASLGEASPPVSTLLVDARARLHARFMTKFPRSDSLGCDFRGNINVTMETASKSPEHLDETRKRIRHRFQTKFRPDFTDFPRTLQEALTHLEDETFGKKHAVIITGGAPSYDILAVNSCWESLCGYTQEEAFGQTLRGLGFSDPTNKNAARALTDDLVQGKNTAMFLTNKTKDGSHFTNYVRATPLYSDDPTTSPTAYTVAFLGVVENASSGKQHA
eukprot:scaffold6596_cov161-Amphora_coffeaeformis.AAC.14